MGPDVQTLTGGTSNIAMCHTEVLALTHMSPLEFTRDIGISFTRLSELNGSLQSGGSQIVQIPSCTDVAPIQCFPSRVGEHLYVITWDWDQLADN